MAATSPVIAQKHAAIY